MKKNNIDLKSSLEKYYSLMNEGIDNLNKNKILEADNIFEKAETLKNKLSDLIKEATTNNDVIKNRQLYGENLNFGVIYKTLEENANKLYNDDKNKNNFYKVLRFITENKTLKNQFDWYQLFISANNIKNATTFVNEATNILPKFDLNEVKKENEKLLNLFKKCNIDECINIPEEYIELCESIEYLMFNKNNVNNVKNISESKDVICEYINNHQDNNINENKKDLDTIVEEYCNKAKDVYNNELNEEEVNLVKRLSDKEEAINVFEEYKSNAEKLLNEAINSTHDETNKKSVEEILEQVKSKSFNKETILEDLYLFTQVKEIVDGNLN